ncbi:MAG: class I SAM-dependent methyltransferase [Ilumatobacteraceae bacterium]
MVIDDTNKWYVNPDIYDRFAQAEDPLGLSLRFALEQVPPGAKTVVELGAGTGRFTFTALEQRPEIETLVAVDASNEMFSYLGRQLNLRPRLLDRLRLVHTRNESLPVDDQSVDAVISSWAFPSNMWDEQTCLAEMSEVHRVLKPGGVLITVGWDENFRDQLSDLWYRFVPEPDYRRESMEEWRRRRRDRIRSPRNCGLTFIKRNLRVPLLFETPGEAAEVLGHLFGVSAATWVGQQQRCEFSVAVGITVDDRSSVAAALKTLRQQSRLASADGEQIHE